MLAGTIVNRVSDMSRLPIYISIFLLHTYKPIMLKYSDEADVFRIYRHRFNYLLAHVNL